MSKRYFRFLNGIYSVYVVIFFCLFCLSAQSVSAQVKDSTITGIYTSYKTYWASSTASLNTVNPDTSHNLLAFTFRGKTYSTGVNNAILNTKLGSSNYSAQVYKALPVKSIDGNVIAGGATYIATATKNDGDSTKASYTSPYPTIHIADVLTDGKFGLDLGTGVTNLPVGAHISFTIKSLSTKAATDTVPDLIFTQIADPTANKADTIFFYDAAGKLVGNKKLVFWNTVSKLGTYKLDLYTLSYEACNTSTINGVSNINNSTRDIRMVAFLLTEFGITNADSAAKVKGIQINPNGTSDQAFIAYNTNILNLDVPVITTQPATQTFCSAALTSSATFSVAASSGTTMSYQWKKNGAAIAGATSSSYTATGLTTADTINAYSVTITNSIGSITSDNAYVKYVIKTQPADVYVAPGNAATFTIGTTVASTYQWYKSGAPISGATSSAFSIASPTMAMSGTPYSAAVTYSGGTCNSSPATLTVENLPAITTAPQSQIFCNSSTTTATFNVVASSASALSYQWYKANTAISGATSSSYTATDLTLADTINTYKVTVTSRVGSVTSGTVGFKYLILTQPTPTSAYLATGNINIFTATASLAATGFQWKKDGINITGANTLSYKIDTVTTASAGSYTLNVSYAGGSCLSNAGVLTTSTILYSKATGNMNDANTWGVQSNGSGSTPVNFTRAEHTFIVSNRDTASLTANLTVAGTYDVGDGVTTITAGRILEAGRFTRSLTKGTLAGTATSGLIVHGKSDLYFNTANKVMQTLTINANTTDTATIHTALDITAGSGHGVVKVLTGVLNTGDSLTLKSDSIGTASVGNSAGKILGKVTVERFIPAHRAWRLFCSPVADSLAPTINAAWQEGAITSTDNPHPGFGTHITYGLTSDGFDQNPQKTFSMKFYNNGVWSGVPATNRTRVTDYPAFMFFIRGNRSYNITSTINTMIPLSTIMRTTGYLNQGIQSKVPVGNGAFGLIRNPYASPIDFANIFTHSNNIAQRIRIWDPTLGGTYGVGAYLTVYWNGSSYATIPNVPGSANNHFIQAYEGFFVEGIGDNANVSIIENDKDTANTILPFGRLNSAEAQSKLEVNLKVFDADSATAIADGIAYLFDNSFNNNVDGDDIVKVKNTSENLSIASTSKLLTLEQRVINAGTDSLHLNMTGVKATDYQLEIIPSNISNSLYLYDKYLNTTTPIHSSDTSRFKISINTSDTASKAADRFTIITKSFAVLPVTFTSITTAVKEQAIAVNWNIINEVGTRSYEIQKLTNGSSFSKIGEVNATGSKSYNFIDSKPVKGINYYRVKSISVDGKVSYTSIANALFGNDGKTTIAVYPNPVTSNHCMIEMHNKPAGKYTLTLTNTAGQKVFTTIITTTEINSLQPILLPQSLSKGTYQLQIEGTGKKESIKLITLY